MKLTITTINGEKKVIKNCYNYKKLLRRDGTFFIVAHYKTPDGVKKQKSFEAIEVKEGGGMKRKPGRPKGTTKGRVKIPGTYISKENAAYLNRKKAEGQDKSRTLDKALNLLREAEK